MKQKTHCEYCGWGYGFHTEGCKGAPVRKPDIKFVITKEEDK